jgi:hypothetical protein
VQLSDLAYAVLEPVGTRPVTRGRRGDPSDLLKSSGLEDLAGEV